MVNCQNIYTSADIVYISGIEDTFKTPQTTATKLKAIGSAIVLDSANGDKNYIDVTEMGSRKKRALVSGYFQGSWSVSGMMSNPFLIALFYDWSQATAVTINELTYYKVPLNDRVPKSLSLVEGYGFSKRDLETNYAYDKRTLLGAVVESFTVNANAKEEVGLSLSGLFADEKYNRYDLGSATEATAYATYKGLNTTDDRIPFMSYNANVTFDSEVLTPVESFNITLAQDPDLVYGLGTYTGQCTYGQIFNITGSFVIPAQNMDLIKQYYNNTKVVAEDGSVEPTEATLSLMFDLAKTGDENEIKLEFTKVGLNYDTETRIGEVKKHTINLIGADSYAYIKGAEFITFMNELTGITIP